MRRITLLIGAGLIAVAAPLAIAAVVVGCAGSSSGYSSGANGSTVPVSELGMIKRVDGKAEVSYHGHPLYYYVGDKKTGDTTGQGLDLFGAEWTALSAAGTGIDAGS